MPKAHITTKSGSTIVIEGKPEDVALIVQQLQGAEVVLRGRQRARVPKQKRTARQKITPTNLILSLVEGGFFKKPKDLVAVKEALKEMGHHYPVTTLSPSLLRIVRRRGLRRMREEKRWVYTG